MVIFTRTFDLLAWLLPATNHLPRAHRHSFTRRLLDAAFDLRERLEEANLRKGAARQERLERADEALARTSVAGVCTSSDPAEGPSSPPSSEPLSFAKSQTKTTATRSGFALTFVIAWT